jgi:hypothetical protein
LYQYAHMSPRHVISGKMTTSKIITIISIVALVATGLTTVGTFVLSVMPAEQVSEYEGPDHQGETDCIQAGP